jgi:Acetoacetate decarboxylase (ADC)
VFTNLDRTLVQAVLPPQLKLAQNSAAPSLHPVIYLYGRPTNTSWIVAGTPILIGPNYQELMLLVPFVHESTGNRWHTYVVRMYLDDWNAIWIGNVFFGYAKKWGTSNELGTQVTESDEDGIPKFHADIQPMGSWQSSAQAQTSIPNYPAIQTILAMPVVGLHSSGLLVCSYFEMNYTNATVASVQSTHEFLDPFVPQMAGWVGLGSVLSVANGAVAIRDLNWRIEQPPPPPCLF